jgi:hypothetical protein
MSETTHRVMYRICQEGIARSKAKAEECEAMGDRHGAAFYLSILERYEQTLTEVTARVPRAGTIDTLINLNIEESTFVPKRATTPSAPASSRSA